MEDARRGQKLVGYQEICCHMIFDINMDGQFTRKACYVAVGHTTDPPTSITYYSVVSIYIVRVVFTLASLNNIYIRASDIGYEYLNVNC